MSVCETNTAIRRREKPGEADRETGRRLRALRLSQRCTQDGLASKLGVSYPQLQKYEAGTNRLSVSRLRQVCEILDVDISYFVGELTENDNYFISVAQDQEFVALMEIFQCVRKKDRGLLLAMARSLAEKAE